MNSSSLHVKEQLRLAISDLIILFILTMHKIVHYVISVGAYFLSNLLPSTDRKYIKCSL